MAFHRSAHRVFNSWLTADISQLRHEALQVDYLCHSSTVDSQALTIVHCHVAALGCLDQVLKCPLRTFTLPQHDLQSWWWVSK
jgi:hypothetical protein